MSSIAKLHLAALDALLNAATQRPPQVQPVQPSAASCFCTFMQKFQLFTNQQLQPGPAKMKFQGSLPASERQNTTYTTTTTTTTTFIIYSLDSFSKIHEGPGCTGCTCSCSHRALVPCQVPSCLSRLSGRAPAATVPASEPLPRRAHSRPACVATSGWQEIGGAAAAVTAGDLLHRSA
jgi:hypothetical protein